MSALRPEHLREVNVARCTGGWRQTLDLWSLDDWIVATGGEMGEAMNVLKKLNRARDGIMGNTDPVAVLKVKFADELADTAIYIDLMAASEALPPVGDVGRYFELLETNDIRPFLHEPASRHMAVAFRALARATEDLQSAQWYAERGDAGAQNFRENASARLTETLTRLAAAGRGQGIDLGRAIVTKFNRTSDAHGFSHRLVES